MGKRTICLSFPLYVSKSTCCKSVIEWIRGRIVAQISESSSPFWQHQPRGITPLPPPSKPSNSPPPSAAHYVVSSDRALCTVFGRRTSPDFREPSFITPISIDFALDYVMINPVLPQDDAIILWPRRDLYLAGLPAYDDEDTDNIVTGGSTVANLQTEQGLSAIVALAEGWLRDCISTHRICSLPFGFKHQNISNLPKTAASRQIPVLPTRVIDVNGPNPRLYVSTPGQKSEYFALSYSWGVGTLPSRMTRHNFEARQTYMDMGSLPQTIRDAITFTTKWVSRNTSGSMHFASFRQTAFPGRMIRLTKLTGKGIGQVRELLPQRAVHFGGDRYYVFD
ncbi:hypothetical protein QBC35DRAFT_546884 [Podospora australis]|uniref:Heterokaryon incompatibility domain-containing protein n=1 Tax=Podospora australis TaxID=1536484 RepID=A0AAN6WLX6_9PEZI|nr:hypothetical protein QBC35DRAFT_546884 [Podospora australis]